MNKPQLAAFIIDVLHYSIETIQTLVNHLNEPQVIGWRLIWPHDFTEEEVLPILKELVNENFVQVLQYNDAISAAEPVDDWILSSHIDNSIWFMLTEKGYQRWKEWTPPEYPDES